MTAKESHIQRLETRLRQFDEQVSWAGGGAARPSATLQGWLQSSNEQEILRPGSR